MSKGLFALNPRASVHVEQAGSGCPVLVADDFYLDPMAVRDYALEAAFDSTRAYYPGLHAAIPQPLLDPLFDTLARMLHKLGYPGVRGEAFQSDFSIVTTPANEMLAKQKHPHIDGLPLAGVAYLNPHMHIGTAFFRHVPTGLSMLRSPAEIDQYHAWFEEHAETTQPQTYAVEDGVTWVQLHAVEGRFNRLILYPGNAFHSIDMRDVSAARTISDARLTQRIFLSALN